MNKKILDLKKTVFELTNDNPEVIDILKELGFENITNPAMMKTAGRVMTLPKGAKMKGLKLEKIVETFRERGFLIINQEEGLS